MSEKSGTRDSVGLLDIAGQVPGLLMDVPTILRGVTTGFLARPSAKTSIGKVFQDRAARYSDKVFLRFEDREISYGEANEIVNRYAAVLAGRGVGHGDVVGIMLRNSADPVLLMLAAVKCGAISGMLNYNQRDEVLKHSLGLLSASVVVTDTEFVEPITESGAVTDGLLTLDEIKRLAETAPAADNPATTSSVLAKDKAFYIFTSGTTGMPKASVMTHYRWLRALAGFGGLGMRLNSNDTLYCCLPLYHNNALTVALSSVLNSGATLALGKSFSASKFWDDVIRHDATAFVYIGEVCTYLLNQEPKDTDRKHRVRVIAGNGLRPAIWDDFTERFGIDRVCEFYGASEGNTAFVNVLNVDKTTGICPTPVAFVEYDESGDPVRDKDGRVRKVAKGEPGLLLSKVSNFQPFDGYTDKKATEKKLVRDAFKAGDVWFNTGDLMRSQGFGHAAFTDRLGDTFRWKGENVATTEVEAAVSIHPQVEEATVFGVEVPDTGGRAGMVAVQLKEGQEFDGKALAKSVYDKLPGYAVPLFVRVVKELAHTSTFKSLKVDLRKEGYGGSSGEGDDDDVKVKDPIYVLSGRDEGYVPFYDEYLGEVKDGKKPK